MFNDYIVAQLQTFQKRMDACIMLFHYRMMNHPVKAEPAALMSVTCWVSGQEFNIEDVAMIGKPNDFQFEIIPKNENNLQNIISGIAEVHPEFKLDVQTKKDPNDEDEHHLIYTMPPVNKERHDVLIQVTNAFYDECKVKLEEEHTKYIGEMATIFLDKPEDGQEAKEAIDHEYDDYKENAEKLHKAKLQEIEEGYLRYLQEGNTEDSSKQNHDVQFSMKFDMK